MSISTPILNLFKRDPQTEPKALFNIKEMMNDNWDAIDAVFNANPDVESLPQTGFVPMLKVGSYVGTGGSGKSHPNKIDNIGFVPDFVLVTEMPSGGNYDAVRLIRPQASTLWPTVWGSDSVEWCYTSGGSGADSIQHNFAGVTYNYVIFGHKEGSA